jgi:hypothetical protein
MRRDTRGANDADPELGELSISKCFGRSRHEVRAGLGLWERDDLSNVLLPREYRNEPVEPDGKASMWRRAVAKRVQQKSKARRLWMSLR